MTEFVLISGCSCGGKSTLLDALRAAGHCTISEPGRRIVAEELEGEGRALPWVDMTAFAHRAIEMARADLIEAASWPGPVFFDRGLVDAAVALERSAGVPFEETLGDDRPYSAPVFLAPPWPELFRKDDARQHEFAEAVAEYEALVAAFARLGSRVELLPKVPVKDRVSFVLNSLSD